MVLPSAKKYPVCARRFERESLKRVFQGFLEFNLNLWLTGFTIQHRFCRARVLDILIILKGDRIHGKKNETGRNRVRGDGS